MYRAVLVYDEEGNFLGKAVKKDGADRLKGPNIYTEAEEPQLKEALDRLNDSLQVHETWPDAHDPSVLALLRQEDFYPVEMAPQEVLDEEASYIVYLTDSEGITTEDIDEAQSVLKYKEVMAPVRPSDVFERTRKAQEAVARQRQALDKAS